MVADLKAGLGCDTDEKWFAYTLNWTPALKLKFDSTPVLDPFEPPYVTDNGFEVVTVAFCHDTQNFTSGRVLLRGQRAPRKEFDRLSLRRAPDVEREEGCEEGHEEGEGHKQEQEKSRR